MTEPSQKEKYFGASIIICCYNSEERITETLQHLFQQIIPGNFIMEIILVNNASRDKTVEVATHAWNNFTTKNNQLIIIDELKAGQMYARKTGARKAKFETIIFCDDDNWLEKNYVFTAFKALQADSMIGAAGGQNIPVTNADEYPEWFDEFKDKFGTGIPAEKSGDISYRGFVLGAGLVTRKQLFLEVFNEKYPSLLNGRDGKKLSTGDDFEYSKRLLLWNYKLYYNEDLKLQHFIPKERLTTAYRERLMQGINDAGKILDEYDLAIRIYKKIINKNRLRLIFLSPFRILFTKLRLSKRIGIDEKLILFYLSPFQLGGNSVRDVIKKFIFHK